MIFLTGANGFLGKEVFRQLKANSHHVVPFYHAAKFKAQMAYWEGDLTYSQHLEAMIQEPIEMKTAIHLAGFIDIKLTANPNSKQLTPVPGEQNLKKIYQNNLMASVNLLEYCLKKKVRHLIFTSSQTVYGYPEGIEFTEDSPLRPLEHYAFSKVLTENILKAAAKQGLAVTCLRIPGLFGPKRFEGAVYKMCLSALLNKEIVINTSFPLPIDVLFVEDAAKAIITSVKNIPSGFRCLNIATGYPCSLELLAETIAQFVPNCRIIKNGIKQPVVTLNASKAQRELNWRAKPLEERIQTMLEQISKQIR